MRVGSGRGDVGSRDAEDLPNQLQKEREGEQPGKLRARRTQAIRSQIGGADQRPFDEVLNVKMHAVLSTERRTKYSRLDLERGQAGGGEECLLDFQSAEVGDGKKYLRAKIRVDDRLERELELLQGDSRRVLDEAAFEVGIIPGQQQRRALAESGRSGGNHGNVGIETLKKTTGGSLRRGRGGNA